MDAWIQPNPRSNVDIEGPIQRPPGVFATALSVALQTGRIDQHESQELAKNLRRVAMERIALIADEWSVLKGDLKNNNDEVVKKGHDTFASLWVTHACTARIKAMINYKLGDKELPEEWIGWGLYIDPKVDKRGDYENLNPKVREGLETLIEDVINYIEWALEWPRFIQSVRAVKQNELRFDLNWKPKK